MQATWSNGACLRTIGTIPAAVRVRVSGMLIPGTPLHVKQCLDHSVEDEDLRRYVL